MPQPHGPVLYRRAAAVHRGLHQVGLGAAAARIPVPFFSLIKSSYLLFRLQGSFPLAHNVHRWRLPSFPPSLPCLLSPSSVLGVLSNTSPFPSSSQNPTFARQVGPAQPQLSARVVSPSPSHHPTIHTKRHLSPPPPWHCRLGLLTPSYLCVVFPNIRWFAFAKPQTTRRLPSPLLFCRLSLLTPSYLCGVLPNIRWFSFAKDAAGPYFQALQARLIPTQESRTLLQVSDRSSCQGAGEGGGRVHWHSWQLLLLTLAARGAQCDKTACIPCISATIQHCSTSSCLLPALLAGTGAEGFLCRAAWHATACTAYLEKLPKDRKMAYLRMHLPCTPGAAAEG